MSEREASRADAVAGDVLREGEGHPPGVLPPGERVRAAAQAPPAPAARSRVLIVEDDDDTAEAYRLLLTLLGHDVTIAADGRAGLEAVRASRPAVALIDIGLP